MLCIKKLYHEEVFQLALLLSLLRLDPESYLGLDIQAIGVGSLDLNNGSRWHSDAFTIVHRPTFIHPKNLDSMLLNYQRDLFEDLNSLGRYNRINSGLNDIHAYLLNTEDSTRDVAIAGPSISLSTDPSRDMTSPGPENSTENSDEPSNTAELTQEDMDLIEVLWKQDVDLGFTLAEPTTTTKKSSTLEKETDDEIEKLKALEAINANNEKKDAKEYEEPQDDPWAGLPYTVDLETDRRGRVANEKCKLNMKSERHSMRWQQCSLTGQLDTQNDWCVRCVTGSLTPFTRILIQPALSALVNMISVT